MVSIKEKANLVGVSELRSGIDKILKIAQKSLVIITKRNKPQAVLMSNEEYEHIQDILELAEDIVLGFIAEMRYKNSKKNDYIDIENLLK